MGSLCRLKPKAHGARDKSWSIAAVATPTWAPYRFRRTGDLTFKIERESELAVFVTVLILLIVLLPVLFPAAVSAFHALTSA
jgi:hypothetical protein